jgi:microcystin-dependent protein
MADPFVAEIRIVPFNFPPKGWAFCDGQLLPISQNTALFSLLGTYYGGDGKNNFALPDLRGRSPMQPGQGPGLSLRDLGEQGGQAAVTLLASEMPAHTHALQASPTAPEENGHGTPSPEKLLAPSTAAVYGPPGDAVALAAEAISVAGGGQPHQNRQPFLTLNFVIALQGIFPPRG